MASLKAEIAKGKKLHRAMISYAMQTKRNLNVSFKEALRQMQIQADKVAADESCSVDFVVTWTTAELARAK